MDTPLQGGPFAGSSHTNTGFSPQAIFQQGILSSTAGSQITTCVHRGPNSLFPILEPCYRLSQHHYSGTFCTGTPVVVQDLMSKSNIRSNLTQYASDIAAVQQSGLTYVLGETNSISCHGAPGVSDTAAALMWALDYALFAGQLGITRIYFHNGIGFRYNFVRRAPLPFFNDIFLKLSGRAGSTCDTDPLHFGRFAASAAAATPHTTPLLCGHHCCRSYRTIGSHIYD
jgi:hypothetical protein